MDERVGLADEFETVLESASSSIDAMTDIADDEDAMAEVEASILFEDPLEMYIEGEEVDKDVEDTVYAGDQISSLISDSDIDQIADGKDAEDPVEDDAEDAAHDKDVKKYADELVESGRLTREQSDRLLEGESLEEVMFADECGGEEWGNVEDADDRDVDDDDDFDFLNTDPNASQMVSFNKSAFHDDEDDEDEDDVAMDYRSDDDSETDDEIDECDYKEESRMFDDDLFDEEFEDEFYTESKKSNDDDEDEDEEVEDDEDLESEDESFGFDDDFDDVVFTEAKKRKAASKKKRKFANGDDDDVEEIDVTDESFGFEDDFDDFDESYVDGFKNTKAEIYTRDDGACINTKERHGYELKGMPDLDERKYGHVSYAKSILGGVKNGEVNSLDQIDPNIASMAK